MESNQGFNEPLEAEVVLASADSPLAARRPGGVNFICIVAIILGGMGLLGGMMEIFNSLFGAQMQQAFSMPAQPGAGAEFAKLQEEFQANMAGITERYSSATLVLGFIHLIVAIALLWGGIKCLGLSRRGRSVLMFACLGAIGFEIARSFPQVLMQFEMSGLLEQYFQRMVEEMPANTPPAMGRFITMIAKGSFFAGLVFTFAWLLIKIVFYSYAVRYLSLPRIAGLFGEEGLSSKNNAPQEPTDQTASP